MKILHLNTEKGWRGGEQQLAYLITGLRNLGVTNIVLARKDSPVENWCIQNNIPVYARPSGGLKIKPALLLKRLSNDLRVDIIHVHSPNAHTSAAISAFLGNCTPIVLSRRVAFSPKRHWFTRWKYNHPNIRRVICVSHFVEGIMRQFLKQPRKLVTIHSGVDLSRFSADARGNKLREEFKISPDTFLVGSTAALDASKDYPSFISAVKRVNDQGHKVHAFIIGKGPLKKQLQAFVQKNGAAGIITFTGHRKDVNEIIPGLDIFMLTSTEEGLGTSVLDAFVAGIPVVATAAGGIPEMVLHKKTGWLAPIGDVNELAAGVSHIITNPAFGNELTQNATMAVKTLFSKEIMVQKTFEVYRQVINGQ
jgi:L-malate glycosyltransferase